MVQSIFDLEVRLDFDKEYNRLIDMIESPSFDAPYKSRLTFEQMANVVFPFWPYRHTARTVLEYFELKHVNFASSAFSREDRLYNIQFLSDFIYWTSDCPHHIANGYDRGDVERLLTELEDINHRIFVMLSQNIREIIESLNMEIRTINGHITFIKRDADVDSVLSQLGTESNIRLLLLSYNDFRVESSLEEKQQILKKLADWLEPQKDRYKTISPNLTSDVFSALNNGNIRHNNQRQWIFETGEEQIKMYDKIFKLILHLIREEDIKKIHEDIKALNS